MVLLSEHEGIEGFSFVVTGGLSAIGAALCLELVRRGADEVRCFDSCPSSPWMAALKKSRVICITGDIKVKEQVDKAFQGANCAFHLMSHGIAGKEMLQARQIDEVNLTGTCNVLDTCIKCGIERLVFLSTYNVVFGGRPIIDGNETMDYFPMENHPDSYGRSKALAEQLVLKMNNRPLKVKTGKKLHTCAIRPAAVYGPGEEHHIQRFLNLAQKGIFYFVIGGPEVKTDWVYVDNLVQALLLASMGLIEDIPGRKGAPAAGQAYFISDGAPVNSFKFMQPLVEGLGYHFPHQRLSVKWATTIAWVFWALYGLMYPWLDKVWLPQPPILPAEVHKVGITHYFSILKSRQQLGYVPFVDKKEGMRQTIEYWKNKHSKDLVSPPLHVWMAITLGMLALFFCAFIPPPFMGVFEWLRSLAFFLFRTKAIMQAAFILACALHVGEAMFAWHLASKVDPLNVNGWFWNTLALGFPSLRLLIKRSRERSRNKD